uniref:Phosphatidylinositol-specific phospholipase C X domain-containing protein n=1 Tax=Amblyomma maculatum TaxID=34609 RepID=G3ML90_AMBMU
MVMRSAVVLTIYIFGVLHSDGFQGMRKSGAYITVSSYSGLTSYGYLEVNWFGIPDKHIRKTFAVLSTKNPPMTYSDILSLVAVTRPSDRFSTNVAAPSYSLSTLMKGECLGYWALILGETKSEGKANVLYSSCFTPRPRWMRQYNCTLSQLTLKNMLIPGTHNSGMYYTGYLHPHQLYTYNQFENISHQLAYGIRSLDVRVQFFAGEFYVTHDNERGPAKIREILVEVVKFVQKTGELVLLDFHRFTKGFDPKYDNVTARHQQLASLIIEVLGGVILQSYTWWESIGEIFRKCDRKGAIGCVFVFYNAEYTGPHAEYLGYAIDQKWPNAQSVKAMFEYIDTKACPHERWQLTSIMAELTPKFPSLIAGTRQAAQWVNHKVTEYFRTEYERCRAIISTDYFLGNGMIDLAIEANLMLGQKKIYGHHCSDIDKW